MYKRQLLSLFIVLSLARECKNSENHQEGTLPVEIEQEYEKASLEYSAISRGSYYKVSISSQYISVQNDSQAQAITKKCSDSDWSRIANALNTITLEQIPELKAPSEARFFDGAATAQLKIVIEDKTFESQGFDHGKPPEAIAGLVKEILSLSENIE